MDRDLALQLFDRLVTETVMGGQIPRFDLALHGKVQVNTRQYGVEIRNRVGASLDGGDVETILKAMDELGIQPTRLKLGERTGVAT